MKYDIRPMTDAEAEELPGKLGEYLASVVPAEPGTPEEERLVFVVRNDEGSIIAGCVVNIHEWGRAVLAELWADRRYRRQGLGSMLIREAERAAREKGCGIMCLGTMDFMARPLYEKHGYRVFSVTKDFPRGHEAWSLMKRLDAGIPDYVPPHNGAASRFKAEPGTEEDAEVIGRGLSEHNAAFTEEGHEDIPIARKLTDGSGRMIAGVIGDVDGWDCFDIDALWVEEGYRGRGLGSYLLREAEREAREHGAYLVYAAAGDWNLGFFTKNGYTIRGGLKDYPAGHRVFELEKRLDG